MTYFKFKKVVFLGSNFFIIFITIKFLIGFLRTNQILNDFCWISSSSRDFLYSKLRIYFFVGAESSAIALASSGSLRNKSFGYLQMTFYVL